MKITIQRVKEAFVVINHQEFSRINKGLVVLVGIEQTDTKQIADKMLDKLIKYRIFSDSNEKMNLSVKDVGGEILLISQFTLVADTDKGLRPSFSNGAKPLLAKELYEYMCEKSAKIIPTKTGVFAANMQINLVNDGPVTFNFVL